MTVKAILHIFVEQGKLEDVGEALAKMPEVIDIYEVTGEYDIIATAKANNLRKPRSLISERLMKIHGVKAVTTHSTNSSQVALKTLLPHPRILNEALDDDDGEKGGEVRA